MNNHEIAAQLHITVKTVSNHVSNIFSKLQIADRAQAIIRVSVGCTCPGASDAIQSMTSSMAMRGKAIDLRDAMAAEEYSVRRICSAHFEHLAASGEM